MTSSTRLKMVIAFFASVALISLSINIVLVARLAGTRAQAEKWKKVHERLTQRVLEKETRREDASGSPTPSIEYRAPSSPVLESPHEDLTFSRGNGGDDDMPREEIQIYLTWAIEEDFPELDLTERELEELTGAVMTIRESIQGLREMERMRENTAAIKELQARRDEAMRDFERITGMSVLAFMLRAPAEGGIDHD